jgi:hypothetical protein
MTRSAIPMPMSIPLVNVIIGFGLPVLEFLMSAASLEYRILDREICSHLFGYRIQDNET